MSVSQLVRESVPVQLPEREPEPAWRWKLELVPVPEWLLAQARVVRPELVRRRI